MRALFIATILVGCGDTNHATIDAMVPIDSAIPIDAIPDSPPDATLPDCSTYCAAIQANCTGTNEQYPNTTACMNACAVFPPGSLADTAGNTLGCRTFYAGTLSMTDPVANCPHAGPAGDVISATPAFCSGGNICTSFCAVQIHGCGSLESPLPGDPTDSTGNSLARYRNMANCLGVANCASFDKTPPYSTMSMGDSLACRLNEAIRATVSIVPDATTHCAATGLVPKNSCAGAATP